MQDLSKEKIQNQQVELKRLKQKQLIAALKELQDWKYEDYQEGVKFGPLPFENLLNFEMSDTEAKENYYHFAPTKPQTFTPQDKAKARKLFEKSNKYRSISQTALIVCITCLPFLAVGLGSTLLTAGLVFVPAILAFVILALSFIVDITMVFLEMNDELSKVIRDKQNEILYEIFANPEIYGDIQIFDNYKKSQVILEDLLSGFLFRNSDNSSDYHKRKNLYIRSIMHCDLNTLEVLKDVKQDKSNVKWEQTLQQTAANNRANNEQGGQSINKA
jgi:hypothetical protein